jgi:hypothetical protein
MNPSIAMFTLTGIIADNPWLADFECHGCPSVEAHEFHVAYEWLTAQREPLNLRRSAYSLKGEIERETKEHVGERAFLAAAIACGYSVRLAQKTGTAYLGI